MSREELTKSFVFVVIFLTISVVVLPTGSLAKEDFPNKQVELVVSYAAGGSTDLVCRALGESAKKYLGQPVIVVNKPGGGSSIGTGYVFNAKPDGYTLNGVPSATFTLRPYFYNVPYEVLKFTPIIQVGSYSMGLVVRKDAPWNSFEELITYAKNNPGKVKYTTSAVNDFNHLIMQNIARINGIKWDCVPASGEATALPMVLGGHVSFFAGASSWLPLVEAGKLKILVAFGGKKRMFPDVPTYQELGYDFPSESLLIIIGPPSVPDPIVRKLHDAFKNAMEEPLYEGVLKKMNMQREYRSSEELKKYVVHFNTLWVDLLNKMDIKKKE